METDTMQHILPYLVGGNIVITICQTVWGWLSRRGVATDERVKELETIFMGKLEETALRVQHIETGMARTPSQSDLSALYDRINELRGIVCKLAGQAETQTDLLRTLVNNHMVGERK